ncbi:UDP-N-acetylmuramoylalanyl-D-glutamate--2,6-diaminopimelate ligase [Marinomonas ushuaiensis DSM 15871]|uniref:UDP-N-acetylmuramoyl-L-alanyl-D-glutamate--2,6-diaminopimelate ligase n=1 Tax=Marinomonas ushuaiensis DSM 15871 TaxID=1122207 RepID=X7E351_9GAMM|nr:UDP-N-acetylmuramoylalanyl-D-glutamate--2,6-diaminopimelate ligase [Marinomonas ushuaiensis DSM 15871]
MEVDSRKVDEQTVFFALPGVTSNGWDYLDKVADLGCSVAVVPSYLDLQHNKLELISVADPVKLLVTCLHRFFGHMPKNMIAVTGTNGKSSICYYIAQLAQSIGLRSGLVGTFGVGPLGNLSEAKQTTPDILSLHLTLMEMAKSGVDLVAFEASSHALDQGRIEGVPFQTAVFSNLTRDHLDYHGDMASYALAKQRLFSFPGVSHSVFCMDDEYAPFMAEAVGNSDCYYYSEQNSLADFYVKDLSFAPSGCHFVLCHPEGESRIRLPLLGRFNVQNALAALASLWYEVKSKEALIKGLSSLCGAPGRMDKVERNNAPLVVVDFAHTSDALKVALQALKVHSNGKLICVFGCGGDRDRGKRPLMMDAALSNADYVWLTSDNPRTESVGQIFSDVLIDTPPNNELFRFEPDRRVAIQKAVLSANQGDVVLIAGKGHENYQDIQGVKYHFDDKEEAQKALKMYVN